MYTILITDSNELVTSQKERIMRRSKLVDTLHFLTEPIYKEHDMTTFIATLEYVLPTSREYHSEALTPSNELYKNKLEYKVPFDTNLTSEAGEVEIQITFVGLELDAEGNSIQRVRKTSPAKITVLPVAAWSDVIADSALGALDQRLIQQAAAINALDDLTQTLYETKADNLSLEGNILQLESQGEKIGRPVTIETNSTCECEEKGSIRVIEF